MLNAVYECGVNFILRYAPQKLDFSKEKIKNECDRISNFTKNGLPGAYVLGGFGTLLLLSGAPVFGVQCMLAGGMGVLTGKDIIQVTSNINTHLLSESKFIKTINKVNQAHDALTNKNSKQLLSLSAKIENIVNVALQDTSFIAQNVIGILKHSAIAALKIAAASLERSVSSDSAKNNEHELDGMKHVTQAIKHYAWLGGGLCGATALVGYTAVVAGSPFSVITLGCGLTGMAFHYDLYKFAQNVNTIATDKLAVANTMLFSGYGIGGLTRLLSAGTGYFMGIDMLKLAKVVDTEENKTMDKETMVNKLSKNMSPIGKKTVKRFVENTTAGKKL